MKHAYTSTALALLFGLGVATAPLTADAAGQQQQPTAGQQVEQQQVPGAAAETAPGTEATTPPVTAEPAVGVDEDRLMTHEAVIRAEERFDELAEGEDELDEERFREHMVDVEDPEALFAEIDRAGDGVITREEWRQWAEEAFAEADPEGLTQEQYEAWERTGRIDVDEEG
jgi:hypothetical protein